MSVDLLTYTSSPVDPAYDFTDAIETLTGSGRAVYIPYRELESAPAAYRVRSLDLPNNAEIRCESAAVSIEAQDASTWIMDCVNDVYHVRVSGGTWGGNSAGVFRHTKPGSGSIVGTVFFDMKIDGDWAMTTGFSVAAGYGIMWRDVDFVSLPGVGILASVTGSFNANHIDHCRFFDVQRAITFEGTGQKIGNSITRCWFESPSVGTPQGAIKVSGWCYGLDISGANYFERCAGPGFYDIELEEANAVPVRSVRIVGNRFAIGHTGQTARISVDGRVSLMAADNDVTLGDASAGVPQVFVAGTLEKTQHIRRNVLHYVGAENAPDYRALAHSGESTPLARLIGSDASPAVSNSDVPANRIEHAAAAPTSGTYQHGDVVFNTDMKPGAPLGWMRTASGWAPFGRL